MTVLTDMRISLLLSLSLATVALAEPTPLSADEVAVVSSNTDFAAALHGQLAQTSGNLFYSPFSISTALAMTMGGARNKTRDEMASALHFGKDDAAVHRGFEALQSDLTPVGKTPFELAVANRLFAQKNFHFLDAYLALAKDRYRAPVEQLDFVASPKPSRVHINDWVEAQTRKRIKDLIPEGVIDEGTRLVLVNAIYFKGTWETAFPKKATASEPFTSAGKTFDVSMMHAEVRARLGERDGVQVLELPYQSASPDHALSMVIFLPTKPGALPELERKLSGAALSQWIASARPSRVRVSLPKFRLDRSFALADPLKALGMKTAFDCREVTEADFSGMTGSRQLCISAVIHQAFVDVNEEGTEAAAATAVVMVQITSVELPPPSFRADHPFLFAIRDTRTGAVLFFGRVVDPRG